jgi:hypothetical protein
LQLEAGVFVEFVPLRTREFFRLLKIVTNGAGPMLLRMDFTAGDSEEAYVAKLLGLVLASVPNAEDESIEFIQSICRPVGVIDRPERDLSKGDRERNEALWTGFYKALQNPDIMDTVNIIEAVVRREATDMRALGKRVQAMLEMARKTGQIPTTSSDHSVEPSTSSPQNTDGPTKPSSTSPSNGFARSSRPSPSDVASRLSTTSS